MINRESKILKLRKVTIYGKLYAIDKDNNDDLYDYESALKGIPIKIGKLSDKDNSTGKTVTNNSTGKTRTKKGGINKSKTAKKNIKFRKSKKKMKKTKNKIR